MLAANNAQPRLFESNLTPHVTSVIFDGNPYQMNMQITAYGDIAVRATDWTGLLISKTAYNPAIFQYRKIVGRRPELEPNEKQLKDHIQV